MNVLVTGGCGYVGTRLTEALLKRTSVRVTVLDAMWFGNFLSPGNGDFRSDAEGFIVEDGGEVESQIGLGLDQARCDEPGSTDVGTTFSCTAAGDDGQTYQFSVEITGDSTYQVSGGTPAD